VIGFYDLPLDYLDRFNERVTAVTAEQIQDAYRRRVHPARLAVVMVGGDQGSAADGAAADAGAAERAAPALAPSAGSGG
jgi:zinc protease